MNDFLTRRRFMAVTGAGLLVGCDAPLSGPEPEAAMPVIGYLYGGEQQGVAGFREGMLELGYVEDRTVFVEWRDFGGEANRAPALAAELAGMPVDIIVASGNVAIRAAMQATESIPIVMGLSTSPVEDGFVASLARPGGMVTGLTGISRELIGKRLEVFKSIVPGLSHVGVLWNPGIAERAGEYRIAEDAAGRLGLELRSLEATDPEMLVPAFERAVSEKVDGLFLLDNVVLMSRPARVAELARSHRLPVMSTGRPTAAAGGLASYGPNAGAMGRRAAVYVDKILKGANPADLPVEIPQSFHFVINLDTARSLGLPVPQSVLAQATEIIQ